MKFEREEENEGFGMRSFHVCFRIYKNEKMWIENISFNFSGFGRFLIKISLEYRFGSFIVMEFRKRLKVATRDAILRS
jgi:hypothetical protein